MLVTPYALILLLAVSCGVSPYFIELHASYSQGWLIARRGWFMPMDLNIFCGSKHIFLYVRNVINIYIELIQKHFKQVTMLRWRAY